MQDFRNTIATRVEGSAFWDRASFWFFETVEAVALVLLYTAFVAAIAFFVIGFLWFFPAAFAFFFGQIH